MALSLCASAVALLPASPAAAACDNQPTYTDKVQETPWPLRRLRPDLVWPLSQGAGVTVAVIDSGVTDDHPSLAGATIPGRDYIDPGTPGNCDQAAHGSIVAGVIAGRRGFSPFAGVAPLATILPVRVLRTTEVTRDQAVATNVVDAIRFAADRGADVINLSLVTPPSPALENSVKYALAKNVVIVAAAGNEGGQRDGPAYPAAYDGVIAVAGIDENDKHVDTSTTGGFVDVAAPGAHVVGPVPRGRGFAEFQQGGTSFAAAYVSGLAALLRGQNRGMPPAAVATRLTSTADHPPEGFNQQVGHGVINPLRALTAVQGTTGTGIAPPAALNRPAPPADRHAAVRTAAALGAGALVTLAVLILAAVVLARRARATRR